MVLSILDMAKGSEALTTMETQPDVLAQTQAKTTQEQAKAVSDLAKSKYEKERYGALTKYMSASSTAPTTGGAITPPQSGEWGTDMYQSIKDQQMLQQKEQEIAAEKAKMQGLAPEDVKNLDSHLDKQTAELDRLRQNVLKNQARHMNKSAAILEAAMKSPEALEASRGMMRKEFEALARQGVSEGQLRPENVEKFVEDKLKETLPDKLDKRGMAMLESNFNSTLSVKEQVELSSIKLNGAKQIELLQRGNAEMARATALANRQAASDSKSERQAQAKENKTKYDANKEMIVSTEKELAGYEKELDLLGPVPGRNLGGFGWTPSDKNADKRESLKTIIESLKPELQTARDNMKILGTLVDVDKIKSPAPVVSRSSKTSSSSSGKQSLPSGTTLSPGVHTDSKGNKIKVYNDGTYEEVK